MFKPHLSAAHTFWKSLLEETDHALDATCGNGHDTLFLAKLLPKGKLYALDIQQKAIDNTSSLLEKELGPNHQVQLLQGCHSCFPPEIKKLKLIVYNLGYLPGSDKQVKTRVKTTLKSVFKGLILLLEGGALSITCYPGHTEGTEEEMALLNYCQTLPQTYSFSHSRWEKRATAPSFLTIVKQPK